MCIFNRLIRLEKAVRGEEVLFSKGHPWGTFHPDDPRVFWEQKPEAKIQAPFLVRDSHHVESKRRKTDVYYSREVYTDCYVEMECSLPYGADLHYGVLWFTSEPNEGVFELDVAECYTNHRGSPTVRSDVHYGDDYKDNAESPRSKQHCVSKRGKNTFGAYLKGNEIEVYINRRRVRTIKDEDARFKTHFPMRVIITSNIKKGKDIKDIPSEMKVNYVKAYYF